MGRSNHMGPFRPQRLSVSMDFVAELYYCGVVPPCRARFAAAIGGHRTIER
jgi:hypothetical protein